MADLAPSPHWETAVSILKTWGRIAAPLNDDVTALADFLSDIEDERRLGIGGNMPPEPLGPAEPVPEKLIDVAGLPALLGRNYTALTDRQAELEAGVKRWLAAHAGDAGAAVVRDEADNADVTDWLKQLATFAGTLGSPASGEVDEARQRVKRAPWDACKAIDDWFNGRRTWLRDAMAKMDKAQAAFLKAKAQRLREEAAAEARRLDDLAAAARQDALDAPGDTQAVQEALQTQAAADQAFATATAPTAELTRTRTAMGSSAALKETWSWKVTNLLLLVQHVARGNAPTQFLTTNDSVINAAVRTKNGPLRECPGLEITSDAGVSRR